MKVATRKRTLAHSAAVSCLTFHAPRFSPFTFQLFNAIFLFPFIQTGVD